MRHSAALPSLVLAVVAGTALSLSAATPTFWQVASQADFLKGELNGLAIDTDGRLTLGPAVRLAADTTAPMIWQLLSAPDGSLLAGTGNDGKAFRVRANGGLESAFDAPELQVHALALAPDGGFFAGTSPDGKVYHVDRDGTSRDVFDPGDRYIWALATAPDGTLFVATGEKGVIYRVGKDGKAAPFYTTRATSVTALAFDANGSLLAGTASPGQLLRIDAAGRGFVLVDTPYTEVRAIRLDARGNIYAIGLSATPPEARPADRATPTEPTQGTPIPTVSTEITITAIGDVPTSSGPATAASGRPEPRRETARAAIYRVAPDGLWETFWEATEDLPHDLALEPNGSVLVATGNKGRLLRLEGDPVRVTVVARADAQQVTSLARGRDNQWRYATANPGKVFELGSGPVAEGSYESDIRDAGNVSTWGLIRWRAATPPGTSVQLSTRSGNTRTPDDTWSPWSPPYTSAEGQAIASPKARYLQWKASLAGKNASPILTSVTVAYLPRNTRPSIASITVHPPGLAFAKPFPTGDPEIAGFDSGLAEARPQQPTGTTAAQAALSSTPMGRRLYQKGLQTFVWKGEDEPNDKLQYDVFYRRQGDTAWVPLRRQLWDPILTWDTTAVPDGTYTIKVVATDAASNAPGTALVGERESDAFEVDNTAPVVTVTGTRTVQGRTVVSFTVADGHSPIDRVEYSLDATRWREVYPADGIADSKEERYEVTLDAGATLPITVRAVDTLNNVGSATTK